MTAPRGRRAKNCRHTIGHRSSPKRRTRRVGAVAECRDLSYDTEMRIARRRWENRISDNNVLLGHMVTGNAPTQLLLRSARLRLYCTRLYAIQCRLIKFGRFEKAEFIRSCNRAAIIHEYKHYTHCRLNTIHCKMSVISEQMILDIVQGKDIGGVFSVYAMSQLLKPTRQKNL